MKNLNILVLSVLILFSATASSQYALPYHQNFESNVTNWYLYSQDTLTKWVWCNPNLFSQYEYSHSGSKCMDINPGVRYTFNAYAEIETPNFLLDSSPYFTLSFWQFGNISSYDGMRIEYSTGFSWNELGTFNDTCGVNWYNTDGWNGLGIPGWNGALQQWTKSSYRIYGLNNCTIRFRIIFESQAAGSPWDGPRIDDFSLIAATSIDLEPITINTPLLVPAGTSNDSIEVSIFNNGFSDAHGFTLNANYDVQTQNIIFTDTVPAGDSTKVKVAGFNRIYSADICVTVNSILDTVSVNNQLCRTIHGQLITPYYQNFDSVFQGWTTSYTNSNTQWQLGYPWGAPTNTVHSGSKCYDINLSGNYSNNSHATLETPFIQLDSSQFHWLSFWHNRQTEANKDGVRIEYREENNPWNVLDGQPNYSSTRNWHNAYLPLTNKPAITGNSNGWVLSMLRISEPNNKIAFRFVFDSDSSGIGSGMSIDDFSIYPAKPVDLAAWSGISPAFVPVGTLSDSIQIIVNNYGYGTISNFVVKYTYNSQSDSTVYTGNLPGSGQIWIKLPGVIAERSAVICGEAIYPDDEDPTNNAYCQTILSPYLQNLDYSADFDSINSEWAVMTTGNPNTNWEWGMPAYGATNSTYSGPSCWDVNLTSSYTDSAETALVSPTFDIIDSLHPVLSFLANFNTYGSDGVRLEYCKGIYSINNPTNWQVLGEINDSSAFNWYNDTIAGSGIPIWAGNSGGWKYSQYNSLNLLGSGLITFRFVFTSNATFHSSGFSLDNFALHYPYHQDAEVREIVHPANHVYTQNQPLEIKLKNAGSDTLYSIPVTYSLNNASPATIQWNGILAPDSTTILNLTLLQLSPGSNTILVYSGLVQDDNFMNDTLSAAIIYTPSTSIPYSNNFDLAQGWTAYQFNLTRWEIGIPNFGLTNSSYSPTTCWDINLTSAYTSNVFTSLYSPAFSIEGNTQLDIRFKLNYFTEADHDGLTLYYSRDSINWDILGSLNDTAGVNWYNSNIIFNTYSGWSGNSGGWQQIRYITDSFSSDSILYFRFTFKSDNAIQKDGVSLDDFQLLNRPSDDAGISRILTPQPTNNNAAVPQTVSLEIKNWGMLPLTTLQVSYAIDNILQSTITWNGNVLPDSITTISFPSQIISVGTHLLTTWISAPGDQFSGNDSLKYFFNAIQPIAIPYNNNFVVNGGGFQVQTFGSATTLWQYGYPNFGNTTGAFSGSGCWDVNLTTAYSNSANTVLVTPHFDFSNVTSVHLSFWLKYKTELDMDGVFLQYSTDETNWFYLGMPNDPSGINWYPTLLYNGTPGWSGNSNGWHNVSLNSTQLAGLTMCRLRFVFISNTSVIGDGVSIDDFSMSPAVGMDENLTPSFTLYPNPANETIYLEQLPAGKNTLVILDALGRVVFKEIKSGNARIDCSEFATGTYVVKVETEKGEVGFRKFIKH